MKELYYYELMCKNVFPIDYQFLPVSLMAFVPINRILNPLEFGNIEYFHFIARSFIKLRLLGIGRRFLDGGEEMVSSLSV